MPKPKKEPERAREILDYFMRNPQAADTLEGIARWRLLEEAIDHVVEDTRAALEWLMAEGYLEERSTAHSPRIYSLKHEEVARARLLLGRVRGPGEDPEGTPH
jgi:hypothetical protein